MNIRYLAAALAISVMLFMAVIGTAHAECHALNGLMQCDGLPNLTDYRNGNTSQKVYDDNGNFRGNLNNNPYDNDRIGNNFGKLGQPYIDPINPQPYYIGQ